MAGRKADEEKRNRKSELQHIRRLRERKNPEAYEKLKARERERWQRRVQQDKVKKIEQLSRREKKTKRKMWIESSQKYRGKKKKIKANKARFIEEITPPQTTVHFNDNTSRRNLGRKKVRRDRARAYRRITKLECELSKLKRKYLRYKSK